MRFFLFGLLLALMTPSAFAQKEVSGALEKQILNEVFSLRAEKVLPKLGHFEILDRISRRTAITNLEQFSIGHVDSEGKSLSTRSFEEGYPGPTGEIEAVLYRMCSLAESDPVEYARDVSEGFKNLIRNSPSHYRGLTSQTGHEWNQYGDTILHHQEEIKGICMEKTVLSIVLGVDTRRQ